MKLLCILYRLELVTVVEMERLLIGRHSLIMMGWVTTLF